MAIQQVTVDVIVCDICGKQSSDITRVKLGWDDQAWTVDLCDRDYTEVGRRFDAWISQPNAAKSTSTSTPKSGEAKAAARTKAKPSTSTTAKAIGKAKAPARTKAKSPSTAASADRWEYLEGEGFTRHRGRLTAAEQAALAARA